MRELSGTARLHQAGAPFESDWRFAGMYADRLATVDARVAAYAAADPTNDPAIVGSGREARLLPPPGPHSAR